MVAAILLRKSTLLCSKANLTELSVDGFLHYLYWCWRRSKNSEKTWQKNDMHASSSVGKSIWPERWVIKNSTLHPLCTLHYAPCPLSYKLHIAPPTWLLDAVIKFRNCNWYLPHLYSQFPNKTKRFKIPASIWWNEQ